MIRIRKARDRGHFDHGWLNTYHTFSFGEYRDPNFMKFRSLRVMNEDWVEPGQGFGMHPHRDMEIITYVLEGSLEHKDSMGNGSVIRRGEFQRISSGTGILHSEFNPSDSEKVHLYQIWLLPERKGIEPSYEQKVFAGEEKSGQFRLVASQTSREGSLSIHQDADIYLSNLEASQEMAHSIRPGRHAWLQVLSGNVSLNQNHLEAGDGVAVSEEKNLVIRSQNESEVMLFDLS